MTAAGRAFAGALLGALLTLAIHPASRSFLLVSSQPVPPESLEECLDTNVARPPAPTDLRGASLWTQLALERQLSRRPLRPEEVQTLLALTENAAAAERENAYWYQARAAFLMASGDVEAAQDTWIRASKGTFWNDYQSQRLLDARRQIARRVGADQAWQLAYVFAERSPAVGQSIERLARTIVGQTSPATLEGLQLRYATLLNGDLLRNGSRSIAVGTFGANMVELAAYPPDLARTTSHRRLITAQQTLLNNLQNVGLLAERSRGQRIFDANEGWRVLTEDAPAAELPRWLALGAVATAGAPVALLVLSLSGFFVILVGWMVTERWSNGPRVRADVVSVVAAFLGALAFGLTRELTPAFAAALCAVFLTVGPNSARRTRPADLGPLFNVISALLASLFGLVAALYLLARSPAAASVAPMLGIPDEYIQTPRLLGVAALVFGLQLLGVPMWALAQRIGTPHVLGMALRRFGETLAVGGALLCVIVTPLAVYADREIGRTLEELVANEPVYYYVRQ